MPTRPQSFGLNNTPKPAPSREQRRQYDMERGSASSRGYDEQWRRLREWYLRQPENAFCACGCGEPSEMVDHIDPIDGQSDEKRLDIRNLQAMTKACNTRKAIRFERGFGHKPDTSEEGQKELDEMRKRAGLRAEAIEARGMV